LIIPQLLLSGVLVKFEDLHPALSSRSKVPLSGEVMASRWAFEALATEQFLSNSFQRSEYPQQQLMAQAKFKRTAWFNMMNDLLTHLNDAGLHQEDHLEVLRNEITAVSRESGIPFHGSLDNKALIQSSSKLKDWLSSVKSHYADLYNRASDAENRRMHSLEQNPSMAKKWEQDKLHYSNQGLNDLVLHQIPLQEPAFIERGRIHPAEGNIYFPARPEQGLRTHFYAPAKNIFGKPVKTSWVNIGVLWLMTLSLFGLLYFDVLSRIIKRFER
jgi:hypothetical protein